MLLSCGCWVCSAAADELGDDDDTVTVSLVREVVRLGVARVDRDPSRTVVTPKSRQHAFTQVNRRVSVDTGDLERQDATGVGLDLDEVALDDVDEPVELRESPCEGVPLDQGTAFVTRCDSTTPVAGEADL